MHLSFILKFGEGQVGVSGTCTWYMLPGSWKWVWSRESKAGQAEKIKIHNKRGGRVTQSAPCRGRFPARRGRASLRQTGSWCSACSPSGSSHPPPEQGKRGVVEESITKVDTFFNFGLLVKLSKVQPMAFHQFFPVTPSASYFQIILGPPGYQRLGIHLSSFVLYTR